MAGAILLEHYTIPEKGTISVQIDRSFSICVTAAEARSQVDAWLHDEVSYMIGAGEPLFVVDNDKALWRVPAIFTAPHVGTVGAVGAVDVNVQTGELLQLTESETRISQEAQKLAAKMPTYQMKTETPSTHLANDLATTVTAPSGSPLDIIAATN